MGEERWFRGFLGGNRREKEGWIILGCIFRRWDVGIRTGLGWSRIRTGGGGL